MIRRAPLRALFGLALSFQAAALLGGAIDEGERLYRVHCQGCHGPGGKGDGPMSDRLVPPPPDLTLIALSHDGEFPTEEIYQIIDGRRETPAHGSRQMPVWGFTFQASGRDSDQEDDVRALITALTEYLESIQKKQDERQGGEPSPR